MKALGECDKAFENVETVRLKSIPLAKSYADCEKALKSAKPADEEKRYQGLALTALNTQVIQGVKGFTGFSKNNDFENRGKIAEQFLTGVIGEDREGRRRRNSSQLAAPCSSELGEKLEKTYNDEGDGLKNNNTFGKCGRQLPFDACQADRAEESISDRLRADLEKLNTAVEKYREAENSYKHTTARRL